MKRVIFVIITALVLMSCGSGAKIKGHIVCSGEEKETVYLESISATGQSVVDSVVAENGKFVFRVDLADGESAIFNIKCGHYMIPLILSPGETVVVKGFGNVTRNYTVEGSQGSEQLRELTLILNNGVAALDSLTNLYTHLDPADSMRKVITRQYVKSLYKTKQDHIKFIISNPGSLAAVYGLYQRLPNDQVLFNGPESDVIYFRIVADSLEAYHPSSPYLESLRKDIQSMEHGQAILNPDNMKVVTYPDIELPDMYGKKIKLSSLEGNVVLIDFWSASVPKCLLNNAELKELYSELRDKGFEIYQASVDTNKVLWINSVQEQKLPWITLCDFYGSNSSAIGIYNIKSIPANFILDRQGNFAGKNLYGKALADKLNELL